MPVRTEVGGEVLGRAAMLITSFFRVMTLLIYAIVMVLITITTIMLIMQIIVQAGFSKDFFWY